MCARTSLLWLILSIAPALQAAPVGSAFTYQGRLDVAGEPAEGLFDFELCLFDTEAATTPLACIAREEVAVTRGVFTLALDFGAAAFVGEARQLGVGVRASDSAGAFEPLLPRQAISSTPQALHALDADHAELATATPWTGLTNVPAGFADGIDDIGSGTVTSITAGTGLSGGTVTTSGTIGIADGGVGLAQIDTAQVQRRVTGSCSAGSTIAAIAANGTVSCLPPPRRAHIQSHLNFANAASGTDLSVVMRADGRPLIAYFDVPASGPGRLAVYDCANAYCTFGATRVVDASAQVGWEASIALRSDGRPVIAYHDIDNGALKIAVCATSNCSSITSTTTLVDDASDRIGFFVDLEMTATDRPAISYARFSADFTSGAVQYLRCADAACTPPNAPVTISAGLPRTFTALVMDGASRPQVIYDRADGDARIELVHCTTLACSANNGMVELATLTGPAGQGAGATASSSGAPVISYYDGSTGDLRVATCLNWGCTLGASGRIDALALSEGDVGSKSSIVIAPSGLPVVVYYDATREQYRLMRCFAYCITSEQSVEIGPSRSAAVVGSENSLTLTLDAAGNPFAAVTLLNSTSARFRTLKCESADCR